MRVKVLVPFVLHDGRSFQDGDEANLDAIDAKPLLKVGYVAALEKKKENAMNNPIVETRDEPIES